MSFKGEEYTRGQLIELGMAGELKRMGGEKSITNKQVKTFGGKNLLYQHGHYLVEKLLERKRALTL